MNHRYVSAYDLRLSSLIALVDVPGLELTLMSDTMASAPGLESEEPTLNPAMEQTGLPSPRGSSGAPGAWGIRDELP